MATIKNKEYPYEILSLMDLKNEIWKKIPIPEFEGFYLASNLGRIKSKKRPVSVCKGGYRIVEEKILKQGIFHQKDNDFDMLHITIRGKGFFIHRLIGLTFLENFKKSSEISPIDKDYLNCKCENLKIITKHQRHKISGKTYSLNHKQPLKFEDIITKKELFFDSTKSAIRYLIINGHTKSSIPLYVQNMMIRAMKDNATYHNFKIEKL